MRKKNMFLLATGLVAAFCTTAAQAQDYPHKPIRLIVPYAAGGVTDVISRAIARQMSEQLKQVVVVDNRTGAGGNIGTDMIAKAAPDGYTIGIVTNGPMAANKTLYSHLPYNPETDFTPITLLFTVPYMVFVHPSLGVNNVQELVKLLKANPGKYSYAHGGIGTAQHFAGEQFATMASLKLNAIGYKGEAPAVSDVLGGHVPIGISSYTSIGSHYKSGGLRIVAVTTQQRSPLLPDVPTLDESGLKGYEVYPWFGLAGPAGMPPEVAKKLHEATVASLKSPEVQKAVGDIGGTTGGNSPQDFARFISSEIPRWGEMVKQSGAKAN